MADIEKSHNPAAPPPEKAPVVSESSDAGSNSNEEDAQAIRQRILEQRELEKTDPPVLPLMTLFRRKTPHPNLDQIATQPSVYDDPETAKYFQPTEKYENLHRFDPSFRWTWAEELVCYKACEMLDQSWIMLTALFQPLINKIDWKITLWACIAFFALDLDRGNLSQANTDNFLDDMKLSTNGNVFCTVPDLELS